MLRLVIMLGVAPGVQAPVSDGRFSLRQEVDEHMAARYGDRSARNAVFAESATQLRLEAAAMQNDKPLRPATSLPIAQVWPCALPLTRRRRKPSRCH